MTAENCPHCGNTRDEQSAEPIDPQALAGPLPLPWDRDAIATVGRRVYWTQPNGPFCEVWYRDGADRIRLENFYTSRADAEEAAREHAVDAGLWPAAEADSVKQLHMTPDQVKAVVQRATENSKTWPKWPAEGT